MSPTTWSWNKMTHENQSWKNKSEVKRNEKLNWKIIKITKKVKNKIGKNQLRELKGM
jgi:hypothetical protein